MNTQLEPMPAPHYGAAQILVVDDDPSMRNLVRVILQTNGYTCVTAGGTTEALALLGSSHFDLLISDVHMRDGNGLELARSVRQSRRQLPIILMTGFGSVKTAVGALKTGVTDYLLKPVDPDQLLCSIQRSIECHRMQSELDDYRSRLEEMVAERTAQLDRALTELRTTCEATLRALGVALDYRDHETQGHCERVAHTSRTLATHMALAGDELTAITYGAYLHDIGKMAIPDSILLKAGALTLEEQTIMRTHVDIGFEMLMGIPFLSCAAEVVRAHHERFDGLGYPRGLAGNNIPLGARIFVIADTIDAITSDRPYRKARSFEAATEEILRCMGTQFDPDVANAFLSLPNAAERLADPKACRHQQETHALCANPQFGVAY